MHLTKIVLNDGRAVSGNIEKQRIDVDNFENSYIKLFDGESIYYIKDMKSAVTENERISISKIGDLDEIAHMKELYEKYKTGEISK